MIEINFKIDMLFFDLDYQKHTKNNISFDQFRPYYKIAANRGVGGLKRCSPQSIYVESYLKGNRQAQ